jgi:hypothetical protein
MILYRVVALALVCIVAGTATASAAVVSPMGGDVRISSGQGFHPIAVATEVAAGGQVMVGPGGAATIAYSATCVVPASPAAITVVASRPACGDFPKPSYFGFAQSEEVGLSVEEDAFGFTPKVGIPRTAGGSVSQKKDEKEEPAAAPVPEAESAQLPRPPPPPPPAPEQSAQEEAPASSSNNNSVLIIGGVVVGAGVLAAVLASSGGDGPASP